MVRLRSMRLRNTSAAKAHRCSRVKLATSYAYNASPSLSSHPSSAVLTPVSILRTTKTVLPQHHDALVASIYVLYDIYVYLILTLACVCVGRLEVGFVSACSWLALVTGVGDYVLAGLEIGVLSCIFLYFFGC